MEFLIEQRRLKHLEEDRDAKQRLDMLVDEIRKLPPDRIEQLGGFVRSMGKKVVSLKEAAETLDVSIDTIRRAIRAGSLKAFQINKFGNWKISIEELERFMRGKVNDRS